ncbi:MAG: sulfide/dihydroorotate dehydrogenase-like FAD/NAD-binding protein [Synergistaceae bacterium]|nr:sulfide/dihydroorotate dehydrogenase-like FAD/NAD-binding protein [Synergistaceae bacterium]
MFRILSKERTAPKEYDFWVNAPGIASHARPGQFVVLRADERGERVPPTIADFDAARSAIRLVFQVVGKTTALLALLKECGSILDISGPLGSPSETENYGTVMMVGVGIAALYPIIRGLKNAGNRVVTILGGRTSDLVIMKRECVEYSDELIVTTDDGSEGTRGLVTDAMKAVAGRGEKIDRVWAIGPGVMMKFCTAAARELGLPIWVSMNSIMVDGTGMCGCCRLSVGGQIKFGCVDGPEFDGLEVDLEEEKISMEKYEAEAGDLSWL